MELLFSVGLLNSHRFSQLFGLLQELLIGFCSLKGFCQFELKVNLLRFKVFCQGLLLLKMAFSLV